MVHKPISPAIPRILLGLLAAVVLAIVAAINMQSQHRVQALLHGGKKISGVVTAKNCSNHGEVGYSYFIAGKEIHARGTGCVQSCKDATIGTPVEVTYLESNPLVEQCGSLEGRLSQVNGNFFALFVIAVFMAIAIYRITMIKDKSAPSRHP